ncbi:GNAT family N-acetyltransferase [Fusibacter bizertensis]
MLNYKLYTKELKNIPISKSFFAGWPNPPSNQVHRTILEESYKAIVCIDDSIPEIIGFITSVSDGVLSAYIPLLEVIPSYQGRGIGKELVRLLKKELDDLYMIDLLCDANLQTYYESLEMIPSQGMVIRNYKNQNGSVQAKSRPQTTTEKVSIEKEKELLLQLEKKFCEEVAVLGAEGWSNYFDKNGSMLTKNGIPIVGKESIQIAMTPFFKLENLVFHWEPTHVEISKDATLALTYGKYKRTYTHNDENVEETGMYMTAWTKQHDGSWKISADIGN